MGLRCLLGHDFGDPEIERDREEDGDQMVVTIRELETCQRCGTDRIISENKEVTSIRTAEDVGLDSDQGADGPADSDVGTEPNVAAGVSAEAEDIDSAADSDVEAGSVADADVAADTDAATDAGISASTERPQTGGEATDSEFDDPDADDGVILPEDDQQRGRGEWAQPDQADSEQSADPEQPADTEQPADPDPTIQSDADIESQPASPSETGTDTAGQPAVAEGEDEEVEILDAGAADDTDSTEAPDDADSTEAPDDAGSTDNAGSIDATDATDDADSVDDAGTDSTAWPDHGSEDEGFDAEIAVEDDVTFSGNQLTPDVEADTPGSDAEYVETESDRADADAEERSARRTDIDTGIARENAASTELSDVSGDAKFYCPNCGLAQSAGESSMRPGDICPECRKGYITERE